MSIFKICKHCGSRFEITDKDLEFYEKVSPIFDSPYPSDSPPQWGGIKGGAKDLWNWKVKHLIPSPTLCPDCRLQRRLLWRNERSLYKRKCDATGENIISIYSPDKDYKVYNNEFWWSDKWDALNYSRDYDFSKTFFEQFNVLLIDVPHSNLFITWVSENSPYINCAWWNTWAKNCYLIFNSWNCEDSSYLHWTIWCKNSYDCYFSNQVENCYELTNCFNCYKLFFSENTYNCSESYFLKNCEGCNNCIWCINLKNKKYCIFNKQYSKEEFLS